MATIKRRVRYADLYRDDLQHPKLPHFRAAQPMKAGKAVGEREPLEPMPDRAPSFDDASGELRVARDEPQAELRSRRTRTFGLIVADTENPFFSQTVSSIEKIAYDTKHDLVLCNSDEDPERERFHLYQMCRQRVDGVIILPVGATAESLVPFRRSLPMVCLDRRLPGVDLDLVILDNRLGSALAVRHLAGLGHTRIALIATHHETLNVERVGGYLTALAECGIAPNACYVRKGSDARQHSGYEQTLLLLRLEEPPTAIIATNHLMMLGTMLALRNSGLRAPDDVSLVGFDEAPWSRLLDPSLTTIKQPTRELGSAAANLLVDRADRGYAGPPREVMLAPTLIARDSSRAPARRDVIAARRAIG